MTAEIRPTETPTPGASGRGLRGRYQQWIDEIDDELVGGALLVSESLPDITRAFLAGDGRCREDAGAIAAEVTMRCRRVEEQGFLLLAREAPVSGDLRRLVAILRLVVSVERSASLLRHVADTLDPFDPRLLPVAVRQQLEELSRRAAEVYRRGLDAWRSRDARAVREVDELDDDVDLLRDGLVTLAERHTEGSELLLLGLLGRYYERIADHGVLLAQHATFAVTGEQVTIRP